MRSWRGSIGDACEKNSGRRIVVGVLVGGVVGVIKSVPSFSLREKRVRKHGCGRAVGAESERVKEVWQAKFAPFASVPLWFSQGLCCDIDIGPAGQKQTDYRLVARVRRRFYIRARNLRL
jgi:hypothetical protein